LGTALPDACGFNAGYPALGKLRRDGSVPRCAGKPPMSQVTSKPASRGRIKTGHLKALLSVSGFLTQARVVAEIVALLA